MTSMRRISSAALLATVCAVTVQPAATPPSLVNYQGVLKDKTTGMPLNATVDTIFTFYADLNSAGTDILSDAHTGVVVSNGLFSLLLGGGVLADGAGPGTYTSLSDVFRDFGDVWLEVKVGTETLSPRVRVGGAAYAMNASRLEGRPASEFLDTSGTYQIKAGALQMYGIDVINHLNNYGSMFVGSGLQVDGATILYGPVSAVGNAPVSVNGGLTVSSGKALQFGDGTALLSGRSPQQIATLRWYGASEQNSFTVGNNPSGVAFDGSSIWVTNVLSGTVSKIRASDGATLGTFFVGTWPHGIAFDGSSVWVANCTDDNLVKLRGSDGAVLDTVTLPANSCPWAVVFDGSSVWVSRPGDSHVTKVRASDGAILGNFLVGSFAYSLAFDGTTIWGTSDQVLYRLRASDGLDLGLVNVGGGGSQGIAFDGANLWVGVRNLNAVVKIRSSDGSVLGTYPVGTWPRHVVFDGSSIWVVNQDSNNVTRLRAADGANLGTFPVGSNPQGVAFDGSSIWVANSGSNTVSKL